MILTSSPAALAADGAREALELRYQAELAIAQERARGNRELADAMAGELAGLLQEYLITRDGTVALDTVDAAFVEEQLKVARAMEEPGVALALDVFSGPGTGYETELRSSILRLGSSEAALDYTERVMEREMTRQFEKLEQEMKTAFAEGRDDARLEARLEALAERFQREAEEENGPTFAQRLEFFASLAQAHPEKAAQLSDAAEKLAERVEQEVARQVERVLSPEQQARRAEFLATAERLSSAAQHTAEMGAARYADFLAHAERARASAEMLTQQSAARQTELLGYVDKFTQSGETDLAAGFAKFAGDEKVRYDVEIQKQAELATGFEAAAPDEKARFDLEAQKQAELAAQMQAAADQI